MHTQIMFGIRQLGQIRGALKVEINAVFMFRGNGLRQSRLAGLATADQADHRKLRQGARDSWLNQSSKHKCILKDKLLICNMTALAIRWAV